MWEILPANIAVMKRHIMDYEVSFFLFPASSHTCCVQYRLALSVSDANVNMHRPNVTRSIEISRSHNGSFKINVDLRK